MTKSMASPFWLTV